VKDRYILFDIATAPVVYRRTTGKSAKSTTPSFITSFGRKGRVARKKSEIVTSGEDIRA